MSETVFLDLPPELSDYETSRVAILSLPFEATTTYGKGTANGPEAIIDASAQVEFYDEELDAEPCAIGIATVRPIAVFESKPEAATSQIEAACTSLLNNEKYVVGLGGEHTVTVGMVRSFAKKFPDISVLQLDAHSDLRDSYKGSNYNHACVMKRVTEVCPYVGVGIRSGIPGERAELAPNSKLIYAHEMVSNQNWQDDALRGLKKQVYITVDLDFFDPAIMPSVGTPEPGGFHWYETLGFLRRVFASHEVLGFDIVELLPNENAPASDFLAAKLVYKMIGMSFSQNHQNSAQKDLDS